MLKKRIIPVVLFSNGWLVQSENFQNSHQSVNFNNISTPLGTPSQLIQSNDPRSLLQTNNMKQTIKAPESVRDILSRLHSRDTDTVETLDDSTANNDRLVSDTMSDSNKSKTKKNKALLSPE